MEKQQFYLFLAMLKDLTSEQRRAVFSALKTDERETMMEQLREQERYRQMVYEIIHGDNLDI